MGTQDPVERKLSAQHAALTRWSRKPAEERTEATTPGRTRAWEKFLNQVDPERKLPEAEREKLARQARRAHMIQLSQKAAKAKRLRREAAALEEEVIGQLLEEGAA